MNNEEKLKTLKELDFHDNSGDSYECQMCGFNMTKLKQELGIKQIINIQKEHPYHDSDDGAWESKTAERIEDGIIEKLMDIFNITHEDIENYKESINPNIKYCSDCKKKLFCGEDKIYCENNIIQCSNCYKIT